MEKKGIHLIDLNRTLEKLDEAANALRGIARSGKKVMFVATRSRRKRSWKNRPAAWACLS